MYIPVNKVLYVDVIELKIRDTWAAIEGYLMDTPYCRTVESGFWFWKETHCELRWVPLMVTILLALVSYFGLKRIVRGCLKPRRRVTYEVDPLLTQQESLVIGKPLMPGGKQPKCQVTLATRRNDVRLLMGGGFRLLDYLVLPTHVMHAGQGKVYVLANDKELEIPKDAETIDLAADLLAVKISQAEWSKIGVSQAKLGPMSGTPTVQVTSPCDQKFSIGYLKLAKSFGRVEYDSSTQPGFSGAAYMNGNVCLGMHLHGGVVAGGYEGLYIYARLKHHLYMNGVEDEASKTSPGGSDWAPDYHDINEFEELEQKIVDGKSERRAIVRLKSGHYHITRGELLDKINRLRDSNAWADQMEAEDAQAQLDNQEYIPEAAIHPGKGVEFSGEGQRPAGRAAPGQEQSRSHSDSKSSNGEPRRPRTERDRLLLELSSVSNLQLREYLTSVKNGRRQARAMSLQIPPQERNGNRSALNSTESRV